MKVKLYGGYNGVMGHIVATWIIEMPFVPIPGMEIHLDTAFPTVSEKLRPVWYAAEGVLRVDVDEWDDDHGSVKELSSIEEVVGQFRKDGWTVELVTPYQMKRPAAKVENDDTKRGE